MRSLSPWCTVSWFPPNNPHIRDQICLRWEGHMSLRCRPELKGWQPKYMLKCIIRRVQVRNIFFLNIPMCPNIYNNKDSLLLTHSQKGSASTSKFCEKVGVSFLQSKVTSNWCTFYPFIESIGTIGKTHYNKIADNKLSNIVYKIRYKLVAEICGCCWCFHF